MQQRLSYGQRALLKGCPAQSIALYHLMESKKTNLAVAADVVTKAHLLKIADEVGPFICLLKTHIDMIEDFDQDLIMQLKALAKKHHFFLFEDRKFADIGFTVQRQYAHGIYRIADWADYVTVHAVAGPGSFQALRQVALSKSHIRGGFLLLQMSSQDHLMQADYQEKASAWLKDYSDFMVGVIAQHRMQATQHMLQLTPGVHMEAKHDNLGQSYITPACAIKVRQSDVIIVGRSIYEASHSAQQAKIYQALGWKAYEESLVASS